MKYLRGSTSQDKARPGYGREVVVDGRLPIKVADGIQGKT